MKILPEKTKIVPNDANPSLPKLGALATSGSEDSFENNYGIGTDHQTISSSHRVKLAPVQMSQVRFKK